MMLMTYMSRAFI